MEKMDSSSCARVVCGGSPPMNILTIVEFLIWGGGESLGRFCDSCDPGLLWSFGILKWLFGMGLHGIWVHRLAGHVQREVFMYIFSETEINF